MTQFNLYTTTNLLEENTRSNSCILLFKFLTLLCIAGLVVLVGFMYINITKLNRDIYDKISHLKQEYKILYDQKKNTDESLAQQSNVDLAKIAHRLSLYKATPEQTYVLDAPVYIHEVQDTMTGKESSQTVSHY